MRTKMKNGWKLVMILIVGMLSLSTIHAQHASRSHFQVLNNDGQHFSFELTVGDVSINPNDNRTSRVEADGFHYTTQTPGSFRLPTWNQIISIPQGATINVEIVEDEVSELSLNALGAKFPIERVHLSQTKSSTPLVEQRNRNSESSVVQVNELGTMQEKRLACIEAVPFEVDTLREVLIVHHRIVCSVTYSKPKDNSGKRSSDIIVPRRYIVVSPLEFHAELQSFVEWKRQLGFDVELLASDGLHRDSIRAILQDCYDNASPLIPAPSYVLLVGDVDKLMSYPSRHHLPGVGNHLTDLYYVEYTDDALPEVQIGRLSVEDTVQLRNVISKMIQYERFEFPDSQFLNRVLLVAGDEPQPTAELLTNAQVNYLSTQIATFDSDLDTLCFRNVESNSARDSIINIVSQGVSHINYSGHCRYKGWVDPNVEVSTIDSIEPNQHYSFVVNNCCSSNNYSANCFGEQLLRKSNGGAIGVIGASNETLWDEDYYWSVGAKYPFVPNPIFDNDALGAYDRLLHISENNIDSKAFSAGDILWAGNEAVMQSGSPNYEYYWEVYNLLGDPSLVPYIGIPEPLSVHLQQSIRIGDSRVLVSGNPGTKVAFSQKDKLLGVGTINEIGEADIYLRNPIMDTVIMTATNQFFQPVIDTLVPNVDSLARLAVVEAWIADTLGNPIRGLIGQRNTKLHFVLTNCGSGIAHSVQVYSNITDSIVYSVDSMLIGVYDTIVVEFCPNLATTDAVFPVNLIVESADTSLNQTFFFDIASPKLELQNVLLSQNGEPVFQLLPGEEYQIAIQLSARNLASGSSIACVLHYLKGAVDTVALIEEMLPSGQVRVTDLFRTTDSLSELNIQLEVRLHGNVYSFPLHFLAGTVVETFEDGSFVRFPWDTARVFSWVIDTVSHQGSFSARSAKIHPRQQSELAMDLDLSSIDTVGFWAKVSSSSTNKLQFVVDGNVRKSWSGDLDWFYVRHAIPLGKHRVGWRYLKEIEDTATLDCAWVDDIRLPLLAWADTSIGYPNWLVSDTLTEAVREVDDPQERSPLKVFPNPAKNHVSLLLNPHVANAEIEIYDAKGTLVDAFSIKSCEPIQYSANKLRLGIFNVVCRTSEGVSVQRLIIVK